MIDKQVWTMVFQLPKENNAPFQLSKRLKIFWIARSQ